MHNVCLQHIKCELSQQRGIERGTARQKISAGDAIRHCPQACRITYEKLAFGLWYFLTKSQKEPAFLVSSFLEGGALPEHPIPLYSRSINPCPITSFCMVDSLPLYNALVTSQKSEVHKKYRARQRIQNGLIYFPVVSLPHIVTI